jgi:predicted transcriptional regulator
VPASCSQEYLHFGRLAGVSTTIRVSEETRDRLASLATATGRPMTRVLDDAVEALERKVFFDRFNRRYQELRDDSAAWSEIEQERRVEEGALVDISQ